MVNSALLAESLGRRHTAKRTMARLLDEHSENLRLLSLGGRTIWTPLYAADDIVSLIVLGDNAHLWRGLARRYEADGLPKYRHAMAGRYLPGVVDFFAKLEAGGLKVQSNNLRILDMPEDGTEHFSP